MEKISTLERIKKYLETKPDVACAYLFGSFGTEDFQEGLSDIDIAVIPKENNSETFDTERLQIDLENLLDCSVDVCDLIFLKKDILYDVYLREECFYGRDSEERIKALDFFETYLKDNHVFEYYMNSYTENG